MNKSFQSKEKKKNNKCKFDRVRICLFYFFRAAAVEYKWSLNYGGIALMWRGGCIIRSKFLGKIKEAFDKNSDLSNLLFDPYFKDAISRCQKGWREVKYLYFTCFISNLQKNNN